VIKYLVYTAKKNKILQMKILKSVISQRFKSLALVAIALLSFTYNIHAQEGDAEIGKGLFNANCASCHYPDKDMTGPALKGARERWIENSSEENFYKWVKNSQTVVKSGDAYANKLFSDFDKSIMTPQQLTDEQIDHVFAYVEIYEPATAGPTTGGGDPATTEDDSTMMWWIMASLLLLVIGAAVMTKSNLSKAEKVAKGEEIDENETVGQGARRWAWNNRGWVGFFTLVIVIGLLVTGMLDLLKIGVFEDYKPEQPIAYSHELHAGELDIDCKYCHNAVTKSKHATIPTVNVCMNCHKEVNEGPTGETDEIAKIHDAAGWDPVLRVYTGDTKPIKWIKVHNLPDHVYFNHSQHVEVGGVDCQQCHGDMKKETVARVMTTADLNAVGVNNPDMDENGVKFTRPTLTMGWCIECHQKSTVDVGGSHISGASENDDSYYGVIHQRLLKDKKTYQRYLEDDVISVAELGGWECAKCHY
jgi:mono/diheme cytochrome c family protein